MLILTLDSENVLNEEKTQWLTGKEYTYPIQLKGSVDSVTDPLIAINHEYGCVTLQASGYVGSYVFKIDSGEGIYKGPQYSKCVEWIDQKRVIIFENLYNTRAVTYYILDASINKKTELSNIQINIDK